MRKMSRRQFIKGSVGGFIGASLFSSAGTPFIFAQTKEPIKLAYIEPLTGILATAAIGHLKGARLAAKHINQAGGIMGRPVRLFEEDDEAKTEVGTRKARRLILEEGINVLHGPLHTSGSAALMEVAKRYGVIYHKYEPDGQSIYPAMHKFAFRYHNEAPLMIRGPVRAFSMKFPQIKRFTALVPDYSWGHDAWDIFTESVNKWMKGVETIKVVHPFGCPDFSPYILKILDSKPDALFIFTPGGDFMNFMKQQKPYELVKKMIVVQYGAILDICVALGKEMEPIWTTSDCGYPFMPSVMNWSKLYKNEMGEWPETDYAACYYDSLFILKQAIEKAQSTKTEDIAKALAGITYEGKVTGTGRVHVRATSHLPEHRNGGYVGRLELSSDFPFYVMKDLIEVPCEGVCITDEEAKTRWKCPFPYTE